jgi:hypothetical protein
MEPMNAFLISHRAEFKNFLDDICAVPSQGYYASIPPPYSTPLAILGRLPPTSREGFLSLPYLIDHAKSFAALVSLWLGSCKNLPKAEDVGDDENGNEKSVSKDLWEFHQECLRLKQKTEECLAQAERAECPGPSNGRLWEELVEHVGSQRALEQKRRPMSPEEAVSEEDAEDDMRDLGVIMGGNGRSASVSAQMMQQSDQRYHPALAHRALNHHIRADSAGVANNGASQRSIMGSRAASGTESPLSARPWRGPARQLSLEILPSSRSSSFGAQQQKPGLNQATSTGSVPKTSQFSSMSNSQLHTPVFENPQYTSHHTMSPGSNGRKTGTTSPENDTRDEHVGPDAHLASGRTSPSQLVRSVADVKIQPWSYGSVVQSSREQDMIEQQSQNNSTGNVSNRHRLDQNSSNTGYLRSGSTPKDRPNTSATNSASASNEWTSERVFVSGGNRANRHVLAGPTAQQTPQNVPYSFPNPVNTQLASASRRDESPSGHSRGPRRDWASEERQRRDERLGRLAGGSAGASGTHSPAWAGHLSSAEEEHEDDDGEGSGSEDGKTSGNRRDRHGHTHSLSGSGNSANITALPQPPKQSSKKGSGPSSASGKTGSISTGGKGSGSIGPGEDRPMSERPLLERMMFKKRKQ